MKMLSSSVETTINASLLNLLTYSFEYRIPAAW